MHKIIEYIKEHDLGEYLENVSFKKLTTYRTGGTARLVFIPSDIDKLKLFINKAKELDVKFKIFGNGSNILASDDIYDGVIIKLSKFNKYSFDEDNLVLEAEAGCNLICLANYYSKRGYEGLEFATGIPATIGGAIYNNAGAYLSSMADIVISVTVLNSNNVIEVLDSKDLEFSYRSSIFQKKDYICLSVKMQLKKGDKEELQEKISSRMERRKATQPLNYPSAGSVFRNPEGDYAGRLIEECNLKGKQYGGALISDKHANFIVNKDNATSDDIKHLVLLAQEEVFKKFNVKLHREQEFFNF